MKKLLDIDDIRKGLVGPGTQLEAAQNGPGGHIICGEIYTVNDVNENDNVTLKDCEHGEGCSIVRNKGFCGGWHLYRFLIGEETITLEEAAQAKPLPSAEEVARFMKVKP